MLGAILSPSFWGHRQNLDVAFAGNDTIVHVQRYSRSVTYQPEDRPVKFASGSGCAKICALQLKAPVRENISGPKRATSDRNTAFSLQALRGPSPEVQWAGKGSAAVGVGTRKHVCKRKECPLFLSIANIANGRYVLDELFRQGRHPKFR